MIITPSTKLGAINEILSAIGEAPIDTLEDSYSMDVENAERLLTVITRDVLSQGWTFNTMTAILDSDAETYHIKWNPNFLKVQGLSGEILRQRKEYIYNVSQDTDKFKGGLGVRAVMNMPFEEIPEVFRRFITARTASAFAMRYMGDEGIIQMLAREEQQAYMYVMESEMILEDNSMALNPAVTDLTQR